MVEFDIDNGSFFVMWNFFLILSAFGLVLLNGFFVISEFGLVKLRPTRVRAIAKNHGLKGRILQKVHEDLDAYLSACQLGITLASLGLGWIGEPAFAQIVEPILMWMGVGSQAVIHGVSFFVAFFTISYLHIVVGELAPKSLAIRHPEKVGLWTSVPLYLFYWAMYPAIWLLNHSAFAVLRLMRLNHPGESTEASYSMDELKLILRSGRSSTTLTHNEWNILAQTLDFTDLEVGDFMHPFNEATALYQNKTFEENMAIVIESRYSRYPYLGTDNETVIGVVHLKDIFLMQQNHQIVNDLAEIMRPVILVSPSLPALELFRRFKEGAPHFAIVGYSGQKAVGFLTLDNLLGGLVGHIRDEFREDENDWVVLEDGSLLGKASLPIFSLEQALGIDIEHEEVESVGGLILYQLEDLPKEGQKIVFPQFDILVKKMNGPRISLVRVFPKVAPADSIS